MMLEKPPGFVVRTEAQKAARDNGYRLERGIENGWLHYASTTAPGPIWIGGVSDVGPWLLSLDHFGVAAELGALPVSPTAGQIETLLGFRGAHSIRAAGEKHKMIAFHESLDLLPCCRQRISWEAVH
jgi:hypothetical protein